MYFKNILLVATLMATAAYAQTGLTGYTDEHCRNGAKQITLGAPISGVHSVRILGSLLYSSCPAKGDKCDVTKCSHIGAEDGTCVTLSPTCIVGIQRP